MKLPGCGRYSAHKSQPTRMSAVLMIAGYTCHLVHSIQCSTDWRHNHNNGSHVYRAVSLQPYNPSNTHERPNKLTSFSYVTRFIQPRRVGDDAYEKMGNSLDEEGPLLVGRSHDPYGDSVKKEEFLDDSWSHKTKPSSKKEMRGKRGVLHLYNMISCATSCDPISYKGYGCYCGFLGSGRPLDGVDNCCRNHDRCYEHLFCPFYTVYLQPYYWQCHRGRPLCALDNYNTRNQFINGCAAHLCECDRQFAMCLRQYSCPRRPAICTSSPLRFLQNIIAFS